MSMSAVSRSPLLTLAVAAMTALCLAHAVPAQAQSTPAPALAKEKAKVAVKSERAVDKDILVSAPIEAVWESWTTKAGIESFFAPEAEIDATVGGAFHIHINPLGQPGSKGADDMRFMALQAPRMLSFDWNAPPSLPEVRQQRTFVVVRLTAVDAKTTRVNLHHVGWGDGGEWDKAYAYFDAAWGRVLANLAQRHAKGPIDWTPWMDMLRKAHAEADADTTDSKK